MTHGCKGSVLKAEEIHQNDPRQRLVILGSGWGVSLYLAGEFHVLDGLILSYRYLSEVFISRYGRKRGDN
jgi:hypothetical protein